MKILLDLGDCFSIPLGERSFGFGQYILLHPKVGTLIRVFDMRSSSQRIPVSDLEGVSQLFPPVFVGLNPPVRSGRWVKIGAFAIVDFEFPKFRVSHFLRDGVNNDWRIWDGETYTAIGTLAPECEQLEVKAVYPFQDVEQRIISGRTWLAERR